MKVSVLIIFIEIILFPFCSISQTISDSTINKKIPKTMFDISYSNNYLFLTSTSLTRYSGGDITLKLNNNIEINAMGLFDKDSKSKHHKLYGGGGVSFLEYQVSRNIYNDQQNYSGHFPMTYSYNPNKLKYKVQTLRFQIQLCHYAFYKRVMIFQRIGLGYTAFMKNANSAAHYIEQYGNSMPTQDPAYITPSNPEGWYLKDNYTYIDKNDLDNYKNGFNAFYKFGMGIKIKQFTPFAAFEFSNISGKFWSPYFKFQLGVNYSILPH